MALDVYFCEDIRRGLMSSIVVALGVGAGYNTEIVRGILIHAQATAALYGLDWPSIVGDCRQALGADLDGLLDAAIKNVVLEGGSNDGNG